LEIEKHQKDMQPDNTNEWTTWLD